MIYICSDKDCYYIAERDVPLLKCPDCGGELKRVREEMLDPARLNSLGVWRMQHLKRENLEEDLKKAAACFERSYLLGNPIAAENLGLCYERGDGRERNMAVAAGLYRYAAENGNISACYRLGICYEYGIGTEKDEHLAFELFTRSAKGCDGRASLALGQCYEFGKGTGTDKRQAYLCYLSAASMGIPQAYMCLGNCCHEGVGREKSYENAFLWYQKAFSCGQNNAAILSNLGEYYLLGKGVKQDTRTGRKYLKEAVKKGSDYAMYILGQSYERGLGVKANIKTAAAWYEKAAEKNIAEACYRLALLYAEGEYLEQDMGKAKELCARAEADFTYSDNSDLEDFPELKAGVLRLLKKFRELEGR